MSQALTNALKEMFAKNYVVSCNAHGKDTPNLTCAKCQTWRDANAKVKKRSRAAKDFLRQYVEWETGDYE